MEIEDFDRFLRERLNRSWSVDERPDGRGLVPLGIDTALLAYEPEEWCRYWVAAICRAGENAVDADTRWLAHRLITVWAGPPVYRMSAEEVADAVAKYLPIHPELADFATKMRDDG